ncbi:glycosyltransferase [Vibrio breoganii]
MATKVVVIQNSIKTARLFRSSYIKKLIDSGFSVSIIAPNDCVDSINYFNSMGVVVHKVPIMKGYFSFLSSIFFMNWFIFNYRIRNIRVIFICHFLATFILTYLALIPFNRKCIVYIEGLGTIFSTNRFFQRILKVMLVKNRVKRLFCNSSERVAIGLDSDIVTNGIGVDLSKFRFSYSSEKQTHFQLLYVGRLIRDKGVIDAVSVLRTLLSRGYNVYLDLVGEVYLNNPSSINDEQIRQFKEEFGDKINFAGYSDNIQYWYEKSDLLLLPSIREGFPVCVMEANAMGIPAICYDVPGCSDAIESGVNGYLVTPFDFDAYVNVVSNLLDAKLLYSISKTSCLYANKNFDADIKSAELIGLVKSLNDH